MQIGPITARTSRICEAHADRIEVRGRDLVRDVIGRLSFTDYVLLLLTGEEPTEERRFFLDALLCAIAEHGLTPSVVGSRVTLAADPTSLHGAVAAGLLGCGPVILGSAEECARILEEAQRHCEAGAEPRAAVAGRLLALRQAGRRVPGYGHPLHRPADPRAVRILELADERGVSGRHVALARLIEETLREEGGSRLPMNVSMPIAAVLLDLGLPSGVVKAVPILARTAGLLGHLAEERERPIGFLLAASAEAAVSYERP